MDSEDLDRRNREFWDELCGTSFARQLGLTGRDETTLKAFDGAYFQYYPYLYSYLDRFALADRRVLEIGLGYGTLGQEIRRRGAQYYGLDIAEGPVQMMRHRLAMLGEAADDHVVQGSALAIPFDDATFDYVYTIGCLHHTGALARAIEEVRRVLVPGGRAVVMVYNAESARQLLRVRLPAALARLRGRTGPAGEYVARMYDSDTSGAVAPHTDFVSRRTLQELFARFAEARIETRNFEAISLGHWAVIPRRWILGSPLERWWGLDLYVVARR